MKLKVVTVGKLSLKPVQALVEEYQKRISHYLSVELLVCKSVEDLLSKWDSKEEVVILEERGKSFTSIQFSKWLEEKQNRSVKTMTFLVGPAEGWPEAVKSKANFALSLSSFTLQHELALVLLMEQLYRACTILKGEPYHK
ncbi:MAG: 23S rRNA (pseudouridine(1915)-N(3))-methyltransferase RlmH [Deltaproteobacteria bacterium]|nr:23S rRNA (pseudouridine(1915)-N(3))-methyltransferase RlmH [Deltaproteobacteria bacterium]